MISGTRTRLSAEIARQTGLANDIARLQDQVSTGRRLVSPSDDPVGHARLTAIRQVQADDAAYGANINAGAATATRADNAMGSLSSTLDRAKELVTLAANGTTNADARAAAATELRSLAKDVAQLAQSKDSRGQALFPTEQPLAIPIGPGVQVAATVSRDTLFGFAKADGGATDIAAMLNAAADAATATDAPARTSGLAEALTGVEKAAAQAINVRADQGLRAARFDARADAIANDGVTLATERSGIEDTDYSAAIALITSKMTTLQAAQAVFAKVSKQTLFDVL